MAVSAGMALLSTAGAAISGTLIGGSMLTHFLVTTAIGAAINALTPKPSFAAARTGYNVTQTSSIADHQIVYGKTKVSGVRVFDQVQGEENKFLYRIVAFTGHEIESFEEIWINDAKITSLDTDGNVLQVLDADNTTSGRYSGHVYINKHLGSPTQTADSRFVSEVSKWTSDHRLQGIAYLAIRMKFDQDKFPNGVPEISAVIKGKKVYDPRTSTTAWSDNPALCIRDFLTNSSYGLGEADANIDDTLFETAADVCDYLNYPSLTGGVKYTANGSYTTSASPYDFLNNILSSMGGLLWYAQGKWRIKPAYWTDPVILFTEDDLRGSISVQTRHSRRDNFNVVNGTWKGAESNWQATDFPPVRNITSAGAMVAGLPYTITKVGSTDWTTVGASSNTEGVTFVATGPASGTGEADFFLGVDGGQVATTDLALSFTSDVGMARRIANIYLERNRQQLSITASFGIRAFKVQVGDVVQITNSRFGWTQKEFEVTSWTFGIVDDNDLQVHMVLREISENVFDAISDGAVYERDNTDSINPFDFPAPTLDAATATSTVNNDGTTVSQIKFSWSISDDTVVDYYEFQWKLSGDTTYNSAVVQGKEFVLSPAISGASYDYRVRAVSFQGLRTPFTSSVSPVSTGDDETIPNAPTSVSAAGGYGSATVTWVAPTQNTDSSVLKDLFQYKIYRGTSANPTTLVGRISGEIFTDSGLDDSTTYYYRVKAADFTGNESAYSADAVVTTNPELVDGADGASVLVVYADDAVGTNQSLTAGSREYVQYVEYVTNPPSLPVSGTFVKFVGEDGTTGQGIYPIYADDAAGNGQSFSPTGKDYVTFYEATSAPTLPVTGQTFVKYVGDNGADGQRGPGRWNIGVTTLPSTSSGAHTDFTNAIGDPVDLDQAWFYTGTIANPTGQVVWIYREGSGGTPATSWVQQVEVIDGDLLVDGTVTADAIQTGTITADRLAATSLSGLGLTIGTLVDGTPGGERIEITDGLIAVYDTNGVVRVKIGDLS